MNDPQDCVYDQKLWDDMGNYCRISLYHTGPSSFELWLHRFNDAVPARFQGDLKACMNTADIWFAARREEGFYHLLPTADKAPIN